MALAQLRCDERALLTCAAASAQPASSRLPFQARLEELARTLQSDPRLKGLSEQQRIDRVEFVAGNTLFVLLHEMGHVLIAEMKLPVLGREEDAADTFAALAMLKVGTSFFSACSPPQRRVGS